MASPSTRPQPTDIRSAQISQTNDSVTSASLRHTTLSSEGYRESSVEVPSAGEGLSRPPRNPSQHAGGDTPQLPMFSSVDMPEHSGTMMDTSQPAGRTDFGEGGASSTSTGTRLSSRSGRSDLNFVCGPLYVKIGAVWALFDATINRKYFTLILRSNTDALSKSSPSHSTGQIPRNSVIKIPISTIDSIRMLHYMEYYDNYVLDIFMEGKIVYPVVRGTDTFPERTEKGKSVVSSMYHHHHRGKVKLNIFTVKCFTADEMFDWIDAFEDIADSTLTSPSPSVTAASPNSSESPTFLKSPRPRVTNTAGPIPTNNSGLLSPTTLPTVVHESKKGAPVRRPVFGQHYYVLA